MGERGGKQCAEEPTDVAIKNPTFQRKMDPTISCGIMQMLREYMTSVYLKKQGMLAAEHIKCCRAGKKWNVWLVIFKKKFSSIQ